MVDMRVYCSVKSCFALVGGCNDENDRGDRDDGRIECDKIDALKL